MFETLVKIAKNRNADPDLFIELVRKIRPANFKNTNSAVEKFHDLLFVLEKDQYLLDGFVNYFHKLFKNREFSSLIVELGIVSERGIVQEIGKRIYNKILPEQPAESSMDYLLSNVFYHRRDYQWFSRIDNQNWEKLFELLRVKPITEMDKNSYFVNQLVLSVELLALRIAGNAMDNRMLKMVPEFAEYESPFIALQEEVSKITPQLKNNQNNKQENELNAKQVDILVKQCKEYLTRISENKEKYGISYSTTIKVIRLEQQIERLQLILALLINEPEQEFKHADTHSLMKHIIRLNASKNNVRAFIGSSTGLVAYQITQHSGKTGEKYITHSKKEYRKMLYSASGGGVVVGFLCIFKAELSQLDTSQFGHAFLYSMNYAFGFIAIYLLHFTLATKQPAMTAATLVQSVKERGRDGYEQFSELFVKVFRSQFIAFVGNVLLSMPVAMLLFFVWKWIFGSAPVGEAKGAVLLKEINFFETKALFHASIAGFYLFLSGLISGYFINRNIHDGISIRIKKHPVLKRFFPKEFLEKVATLYDKHVGGISGNFWFGVFLGMTGTLGMFFGIDIDIRHITFASGNFGLALLGLHFNVTFWDVLMAVLCIGLIGFFNFIVSFSLSLGVAIRSLNMSLVEFLFMGRAVWKRFLKNKRDFFFPPHEPLIALRDYAESVEEVSKVEEEQGEYRTGK